LSDYEDEGYSDVEEEESDEEFNQKTEGKNILHKLYPVCHRNRALSGCPNHM